MDQSRPAEQQALREAAEAVGLRALVVTVAQPRGEMVVACSTDSVPGLSEGKMLPAGLEGLDDQSLPITVPELDHLLGELRWVRGVKRPPLQQEELDLLGSLARELGGADLAAGPRPGDSPAAGNAMRLLAAQASRPVRSAWEFDRTIQLAEAAARRLGLAEADLVSVIELAMLGDIGSLGIPPRIYEKRGFLTRGEARLLREQPILGERIVVVIPELSHLAPLIRASAERYDGGGYPDGLAGEEIPPAVRIVSACRAYTAMVSDRPYRKALPPDSAAAVLSDGSSEQFCPTAVSALFDVLDEERDEVERTATAAAAADLEAGLPHLVEEPVPAQPAEAKPVPAERPVGTRSTRREAIARNRTPGRASSILYPLLTIVGIALGLMFALPIDSPEGICPNPGEADRTNCVLQKVWLHEITVVFVITLGVVLAGYLLFFKLPDLVSRAAAGELRAAKPPSAVSLDDPVLAAASWGVAPRKDKPYPSKE